MNGKSGQEDDFRAIAGMDAAANWLLHDAIDDYLPDPATTPIPFLLELEDDEAVEAFKQQQPLREGNTGRGAMVLGFSDENTRIKRRSLLPVIASREWLTRLLTDSPEAERFRKAKKRMHLSSPLTLPDQWMRVFPDLPVEAGPWAPGIAPPKDGWPDGTVVMAVIDDGFAYAHERFRTEEGVRVQAYLDLNRLSAEGELTKAEIDTATPPGSKVDEDEVYASAQLLDHFDARRKPLAFRGSHGTHVLDLAAGFDQSENVENRPIIVAQLPSAAVARTSGELLDFYVWLGVLYALDRADRLGGEKSLPLVINTSFGYIAGPHDGQGLLDHFLDTVSEGGTTRRAPDAKTRIVLPAGNGQLSRCHATIDFKSGEPVTLDWIVQPDDRTHSVIEIWLPKTDGEPGNRLVLTLTRPDGAPPSEIKEKAGAFERMESAGLVMGRIDLVERLDGRRLFRIAIAPTARPEPHEKALAPAGRWKLELRPGDNRLEGEAHAWIQRDDSLYGYPQRGRQSYFDHKDYVRFDEAGFELDDDPAAAPGEAACPVNRRSLLNAIASGKRVIVAGGYQTRDNRIAPYSAGGPNTPEEEAPPHAAPPRKPDALLPSDTSRAHPGVLAAGARSGGQVLYNGTSVAAPQLARYVADQLARGKQGDRAGVVASMVVGPQPADHVVGAAADRYGSGRLDPFQAPQSPVER